MEAKSTRLGKIKKEPKHLDEFTERRYFENRANSILNKASPENFARKFFKPISYKSTFDFESQSQKNRYFKITKELQLIKEKMIENPHNKIEIANSFVMLHTRYMPSPDETQKFIDFLYKGSIIPSTLNFKEALFYILTYEKHFDSTKVDEYGFSESRSRTKSKLKQKPKSNQKEKQDNEFKAYKESVRSRYLHSGNINNGHLRSQTKMSYANILDKVNDSR